MRAFGSSGVSFNWTYVPRNIYPVDMSLAVMKPFFRVVALVVLLGIAALIGLATWRVATRPTALGWSEKQIRSQITKEMPRRAVLELLGPPHSESEQNGWFYINSYLSREARHHSETPSNFAIFFKDERVDAVLSVYDY